MNGGSGMWIDRLLECRTAFAEQRQRVLAENLANIDTPDYHVRQLDARAFGQSLREALARTEKTDGARLDLRGNAQCSTAPDGRLSVAPAEEPAANVLFHDGTNALLEQTLTDVNENGMLYELSMNVLRTRYQTMVSAIKGQVT
jgi:flagellar basal-body rod protein FlgB